MPLRKQFETPSSSERRRPGENESPGKRWKLSRQFILNVANGQSSFSHVFGDSYNDNERVRHASQKCERTPMSTFARPSSLYIGNLRLGILCQEDRAR